ncbi:unnamed protein product [Pylaiella littoralis]
MRNTSGSTSTSAKCNRLWTLCVCFLYSCLPVRKNRETFCYVGEADGLSSSWAWCLYTSLCIVLVLDRRFCSVSLVVGRSLVTLMCFIDVCFYLRYESSMIVDAAQPPCVGCCPMI